jgi:2-polyprenyl-3-methyl-5-hydroxy-6-metoxy-1,4-benzoquinol methylase
MTKPGARLRADVSRPNGHARRAPKRKRPSQRAACGGRAPFSNRRNPSAMTACIAYEKAHPYVSRGALKLIAALDRFSLSPQGLVCLDLGASTGGFTQVLLERGAAKVYAVDVGHGQLHADVQRIRASSRSKA